MSITAVQPKIMDVIWHKDILSTVRTTVTKLGKNVKSKIERYRNV